MACSSLPLVTHRRRVATVLPSVLLKVTCLYSLVQSMVYVTYVTLVYSLVCNRVFIRSLSRKAQARVICCGLFSVLTFRYFRFCCCFFDVCFVSGSYDHKVVLGF